MNIFLYPHKVAWKQSKNVINILKYTYLLNIYVQLDLNIICYKMEVAFVKGR
ncbi:MAG: hypothetical protein CM15mP93_00550 [Thiotrichaceae bacterium]|nr:MAG: hypothetical protein CM15mP93_00550 [Thiotrichaceae bacterium]